MMMVRSRLLASEASVSNPNGRLVLAKTGLGVGAQSKTLKAHLICGTTLGQGPSQAWYPPKAARDADFAPASAAKVCFAPPLRHN